MTYRYFGIDIHKDFVVYAAVDEKQKTILQPRRVAVKELAVWAEQTLGALDQVVIEVTTNSWHIYDTLAAHAGQVVVANPHKTRLIAEARIKTDQVDALALARLLASRFIPEVWVPVKQVRQHRALVTHRATLSRQIVQVKNRIHNLLFRHNLRSPERYVFSTAALAWLRALELQPLERLEMTHLLGQLELLMSQRQETQQQIARLAAQDQRVPRLMQITGVGYFMAFAILAHIGDIHRFPAPKKLSSYAGLVPSLHQSGRHSYSGHITKAGSPELRWLMVEAARIAVRFDPHWQRVYQQICGRRGDSIAVVTVARKLLVVIWHLLHNHSIYYHLQPQSFIRKLQDWAWSIGKQHLPAASSIAFVQTCLQTLDLHELATALTTTPKGKLRLDSSQELQLKSRPLGVVDNQSAFATA
jgi:transposase